jgi:hypothetical protein
MNKSELAELFIYNDAATLKKAEILLQENNIRFMVRSFEDSAYNGLFTMSLGKGKIFVFKKDLNRAGKILKKENIIPAG